MVLANTSDVRGAIDLCHVQEHVQRDNQPSPHSESIRAGNDRKRVGRPLVVLTARSEGGHSACGTGPGVAPCAATSSAQWTPAWFYAELKAVWT